MSERLPSGDPTHALRRAVPQPPLAVRVRVLGAAAQPAEWQLREGRCVVGAAPGCDVIIDDPTVSRRHVELGL
ncbi:MAG: FHA domain-containing protein, partial [Myxococcales bacterium]|nr:FHA domain-containing protein [Myxococcales bacterium]